jgi:hypothetical protein
MDGVRDDGDLSGFCCQNERCVAYGSYGAGNLHVCGRLGKDKGIRLLKCRTCKTRFTERKGRSSTAPTRPRGRWFPSSTTSRRGAGCGRPGGWRA